MKVVILAGGYGTRLKSVTKEIPKCFLEFGGKKVVERIIEKIEPVAAVDEVIISTNSRFRGQIESWMKHFRASKSISLVVERTDSERNKLGAIRAIDFVVNEKKIRKDLLVIAGDNLFEFDLRDFVSACRKTGDVRLAVSDVGSFDFRQKLGLVDTDEEENITSFEEKPKSPKTTLVCAGLYFFPADKIVKISKYLESGGCPDTVGYLFEWMLAEKEALKAWRFSETWFDIGTEKPYLEAKHKYAGDEQKIAKVLVTGGVGYLGGVLVSQLLEEGFYVRVLDRLFYDFEPDDRVEFIEGDVRDVETVNKAFNGVDTVIHLAALSNDPSCELAFNSALEINYNGTKQVAVLAKAAGVRRFLFPSSCSIYGALGNDEMASESSLLEPVSFYAQLKVASEMQIKELVDDHFDACILRLATLYGHSPNMRFDLIGNIVPVEALVDGVIKLFGGTQCRPLLHVGDAARAFTLATKHEAPFRGGCFNVGSDRNNFTVRALTEFLRDRLFKNVPIEEFPEKVDPRSYRVDFGRFGKITGFSTERELAEGVGEVAEKIRTNVYGNPRDEQYFRVKCLLKKGMGLLA